MTSVVLKLTPAVLMLAALAYVPSKIGLTVLTNRAERRGDIERAQGFRKIGFQLLLGMMMLVLVSVIALALTMF